jgi:predicted DNA-binding transcriptional regulator YafY
MNLTRISRLVQLLGLLQAGKAHNAGELAALCAVSRRTIFRDLDVLRQAGVPLLFDDDQCVYRIPGTYFLPPTNFTADEALAVMILCYELGRDSRLPFYEAAQSAALKLDVAFPPGCARYCASRARRCASTRSPEIG